MRKLATLLALLALLGAGFWLFWRGPVADTATAALRAYPVYSFVRTRNETALRTAHAGQAPGLVHRTELAGPRDRWVTTPNNDTLYSSAFLDLSKGPVDLVIPALPDRYHSVAVMDARTDNVILTGTRDGGAGGRLRIAAGTAPPPEPGVEVRTVPTSEAWLLIRTLVDGPADLAAARAAQAGFVLAQPSGVVRPADAVVLPVEPDPATLLRRANPMIAANPHLQDAALAATGYGGSAEAFDQLPLWRQWLWRLLLPRLFDRMREGIAAGARTSPDGWSRTPPGIGTAEAADSLRAAVALGGLGALPATEAVYWTAVLDSDGAELDRARRYTLTVPAKVPVRAFWSISLYERLPDGRLFFVENPLQRYAVGNRTPGLRANPDGSLTLLLQPTAPADAANWLPTPPRGPFGLVFRAYLPDQPILAGQWRLPPVEPAAD